MRILAAFIGLVSFTNAVKINEEYEIAIGLGNGGFEISFINGNSTGMNQTNSTDMGLMNGNSTGMNQTNSTDMGLMNGNSTDMNQTNSTDMNFTQEENLSSNHSIYKEWVWCKNPELNETTWYYSGEECIDEYDGEMDYWLFNNCDNCVNNTCYDCSYYIDADSEEYKYDWVEVAYCPEANWDEESWTFNSQNCSYEYNETDTNNYCSQCKCEESEEGALNCTDCWYCIEGEDSPYAPSNQTFIQCEYTSFDDYFGTYYGDDCGNSTLVGDSKICNDCECESWPHYEWDNETEEHYISDDIKMYCQNCEYCDIE